MFAAMPSAACTEAAAAAYRAYTTFLLGHLLLEVANQGVDLTAGHELASEKGPRTDLTDYPHLHRLQDLLAQNHAAEEFDDNLERLLDRFSLIGPRPRP